MEKLFFLLFLVGCFSGNAQGVAVGGTEATDVPPPDYSYDSDMLTESELKGQILVLHDQIVNLQKAVVEITRSFSTLDLVAENPSMMKKVTEFENEVAKKLDVDSEDEKRRVRRDLDAPLSPMPTADPSSYRPNQMGPYSWPMYSGQCFLCPAGVPGPRGPPGSAGVAGRDGRDGRDAQIGAQVAEPDVQATPQPHTQVIHVNSTGGVVYIRWGKSECPQAAELIYAGTIGGAHFTHIGSGSNHLCLPPNPIYDEFDGANADRALLYSSEYQTSAAPTRLRPVHDQTPVCAVCRAPSGRTTKLMVPARNVCPSADWRLEYSGYLMSERYTHKRSEFICVDRALEAEPGTHGNQDGTLLYMVEGRCLVGGGMPCGPYVEGYELTCAVCTI